jgi:hypothetical protein
LDTGARLGGRHATDRRSRHVGLGVSRSAQVCETAGWGTPGDFGGSAAEWEMTQRRLAPKQHAGTEPRPSPRGPRVSSSPAPAMSWRFWLSRRRFPEPHGRAWATKSSVRATLRATQRRVAWPARVSSHCLLATTLSVTPPRSAYSQSGPSAGSCRGRSRLPRCGPSLHESRALPAQRWQAARGQHRGALWRRRHPTRDGRRIGAPHGLLASEACLIASSHRSVGR